PPPEIAMAGLDARSHRGRNGDSLTPVPAPAGAFLGAEQVRWLIDALARSTATWKIIACDQPISLIITDGGRVAPGGIVRVRQEGVGRGDAPPLGREHEIAAILSG